MTTNHPRAPESKSVEPVRPCYFCSKWGPCGLPECPLTEAPVEVEMGALGDKVTICES